MRPEMRHLVETQQGLFTRPQLLVHGHSAREIRSRTGMNGDWQRVRRGIYCEKAVHEAASPDDRFRLRSLAALLSSSEPAVLSHSSASALLGLPMLDARRDAVHVTRPGVTGGRAEAGVHHHRSQYYLHHVTTVGLVALTTPARTAADMGRTFGYVDGLIAADAALGAGTTQLELAEALEIMWAWPGVNSARRAIEDADGGAETIGETLLRILVLEIGAGRPTTQFEIRDGSRRAVADLRLGPHLFEFDGRVKYQPSGVGGVADRPPHEVVWREKQREDWLRSLGWGISRVTWSELMGPARRFTLERLRREYAASVQRHGRVA